ncbi:hypothetical protein ACQ7HM_05075 [Williamsia sp. MIQD14]|uniref:hypothetical protein n=1 Tax=Williamsia sp. MIQD14 TaxID=3425703 RepID=UPI003DA02775
MLTDIVIAVAVICFILYRQMRPTPVGTSPRTAIILTAVGAFVAAKSLDGSAFDALDVVVLGVSTVVGLAIAVVRAHSVRIYRDPAMGTAYGRGTVLTAGLWLIGIAAHVGIDLAASSSVAGSTLLFYLGSVLLVQNLVVSARARRAGLPLATTDGRAVTVAR